MAGIVSVLLAGSALVLVAPPAQGDQSYYVPISGVWTIVGHGYGHGHGMSQYGAEGAAQQGRSYTDIVNFYYPKTTWSRVTGRIRVLISADTSSDLQVRAARGLTVRDLSDRAHWTLPRRAGVDRWRLTPSHGGRTSVQFHDGSGWNRWRIPGKRTSFASDGQFQAPSGVLTLLEPGGVSKRYRGILRSVRPHRGADYRDTVNVLGLDAYTQGVVPYEMPTSWHRAALRSQAVAARTYAVWQRNQNRDGYYQICDTTSCQVYGGVASEVRSSNRAVSATAGKILTYHGKAAFTQFSSSSGGWTSAGGEPYLPAKRDPYDDFAGNSMHDWSVHVSVSSLENSYPSIGRLQALRVTKRDGHGQWHGRIERLVLEGSRGKVHLSGDDLRWQYGLRSNWLAIVATPIISHWHALGGRRARIGDPLSREFQVGHGAIQRFERGRIYWTRATGAHALRGRILTAYRDWGGATSHLGWPVSGIVNAAGPGHRARFQRGAIFSTPRTGARVLFGAILDRYKRLHAASGWLGYPRSNVYHIHGGRRARFEHGVISWDRSSGRFDIKHTH